MNDGLPASTDDQLEPPPLALDLTRTAFFFDLDGTLAPIVDDPAAARVDPEMREAVDRLHAAAGGAVAIVSGREIARIDRLMAPLVLPAAGVHGLEMRGFDGVVKRSPVDRNIEEAVFGEVEKFARERGLLAETKTGSIALHFRRRPDMESECLEFARQLVRERPQIHPVQGKMVIEFKLGERDKGSAIADFMGQSAFADRQPVFVGDDVTDEDGFAEVTRRGGIAVKIGPEPTRARFRLSDVDAHRGWLSALALGGA